MRPRTTVRLSVSAAIALAFAGQSPRRPRLTLPSRRRSRATRDYWGQTECRDKPQPGTLGVVEILRVTFPEHADFSLMRGCDVGPRSEHKDGRAIDWMVDVEDDEERDAAEDFIDYLTAKDVDGKKNAHLRRLGIMYVIWNEEILRSYDIDEGWQPMTGRTSTPRTCTSR